MRHTSVYVYPFIFFFFLRIHYRNYSRYQIIWYHILTTHTTCSKRIRHTSFLLHIVFLFFFFFLRIHYGKLLFAGKLAEHTLLERLDDNMSCHAIEETALVSFRVSIVCGDGSRLQKTRILLIVPVVDGSTV